jgi:acetyltransferase
LEGSPETPHLIIAPYPSHLVAPWRLTDGTEVLLRPIKPEDEQLIAEMLATMTEASLRDRFFGGIPAFTHERHVRFTNIDYERELAIIAELTKGKSRRILGVGRLIGYPERGHGEFSVIVHDEFQRRGPVSYTHLTLPTN